MKTEALYNSNSALKLQPKSNLVTSLIEILAVNERGEPEDDPVSDLLLVPETNLTGVVDLGSNTSRRVENVAESHSKTCRVTRRGPTQVHSGFYI